MTKTSDIKEIIDKWVILGEVLNYDNINDVCDVFIKQYVKSLLPHVDMKKIDDQRYITNIGSGYIFYYGCILYVIHYDKWGDCIESIGLYNDLYMLVDHYIDDMLLNEKTKLKTLFKMKSLLDHPNKHHDDHHLGKIASVYSKLLLAHPKSKPYIKKLFSVEVEGMHIQSSDKHDREVYYQIALKKGGYTVETLTTFVNDTKFKKTAYDIGAISQLVDDCFDLQQDMDDHIHTIATHDYKIDGNLDRLWYDIINRIDNIDSRFLIFRIIYYNIAVYIVLHAPTLYSENVKQYTKNIIIKKDVVKETTLHIYNEFLNQLIKSTK